jgi:hypothetical protein
LVVPFIVEVSEVRWQGQAVDFISNAGFNCEWAKSLMGQFGQWSVYSDITSIQPDLVAIAQVHVDGCNTLCIYPLPL